MTTPSTLVRESVSAAEWTCRVELAGMYRIFDRLGWTEMIFNHISLRLPDQPHMFLLNPFGLHYSEVCASNLVKVDVNGAIHSPTGHGINPAGFTPHSTIHQHVPNAHCVMHTHTTAGMAVACFEGGLTGDNFYSAQLIDQVAYHDFEGITVHADEGPRLVNSIGNKKAVILRNHGLLAWGESLDLAFAVLWTLQRACEVQVQTAMLGKAIPISKAVQKKSAQDSLHFTPEKPVSKQLLAALLRQQDKLDESYKY
jgi:ribulose-5-phosphate 4-epimerase/fuculose-1-phosphate aldolase